MAITIDELKRNVFPGESGGDYNALYGYANRPGGQFSGVNLTDMTVDQALQFAKPSGPYAASVRGQVGRTATPMGAYQVVGTTLRGAKEGLGLTGQERMTPQLQDAIGMWIYQNQGPGAWEAWGGNGGNVTRSSKGTGMGLLDMPAEQPQTFGQRLGQDFRSGELMDRLAVAFNSMRMNPDPNIGAMIENRQARRAEADVANRTAQWLRSRGREDLAGAVESGTLGGREAASIFYQPAEAQGQVVTAEQLRAMYPGTQIEEGIYSQKPDGTISKVGGAAGPTVNVTTGGGKFEEGFAKADADLLGSVYASGLQATRNLGRIDQLGTLLQSAPTGAEGAFKLAAGEFGIATEGLDDAQAAQALINSLVPEQRQPGSGPMSDADLALFKQSLPRIVNQPGGNALILDTMRGIAQYDAQGAQIVQQLRSGAIDRPTAFQMLQDRQNPLGSFKAPAGAAGGGAGQSVVIDGVTIRKVN